MLNVWFVMFVPLLFLFLLINETLGRHWSRWPAWWTRGKGWKRRSRKTRQKGPYSYSVQLKYRKSVIILRCSTTFPMGDISLKRTFRLCVCVCVPRFFPFFTFIIIVVWCHLPTLLAHLFAGIVVGIVDILLIFWYAISMRRLMKLLIVR